MSHRSIERLVEAGLLNREQVTARAPWEIRRSDLDAVSRSAVSSISFNGQASSFCEGVARKINLTCSLKINQMIMPGTGERGFMWRFWPGRRLSTIEANLKRSNVK